MTDRSRSRFLISAISLILVLVCVLAAQGQTFKVLHKFTGKTDGGNPGGLVIDAEGNLYGTSGVGGSKSLGGVFEVTAKGKESVLYSFTSLADGFVPTGPLSIDSAGNLYGTTTFGGEVSCDNGVGCGTVFKVDKAGVETVLHSFKDGKDGAAPFFAGVILDTRGNLYGTTTAGGIISCMLGGAYAGCGVVFRLSPTGTETVLHTFSGADGLAPEGGLIMDTAGNLYGTTNSASDACGTVFKLSSKNAEKVLYNFPCSATEDLLPTGALISDKAGNLYGVTSTGGTNLCGTVFKLNGKGKLTNLYSFPGGIKGCQPVGGTLLMDAQGDLYGTTDQGGDLKCPGEGKTGCGTIFKLNITTSTLTVLHSFNGSADGTGPNSLVMDVNGNLFGTAGTGGTRNNGTVFKLTP